MLVVGGGIGGMQASLDLAEAGLKVYLVERSPAIGGTMAQLDKTFPTNDCAMCIMSPKLVEVGRHLNIDILTNAELEGIEGQAGASGSRCASIRATSSSTRAPAAAIAPRPARSNARTNSTRPVAAQGDLQALSAGNPQRLRHREGGHGAVPRRLSDPPAGPGLCGLDS